MTHHASTRIPTADASKYILKLCRHFAHKVPAAFTAQDGQVRFLQGQCVMKADAESLGVYLRAESLEGIQAMQFIIDDHLKRFVRFETLAYGWDATVPPHIQPELAALSTPESTS